MKVSCWIIAIFISFSLLSFDLKQTRRDFYSKNEHKLENAVLLRDYFLDEAPDSIFNIGTNLIQTGLKTENSEFLHYGKLLTASYFNKKNKTDLSVEYLKDCVKYYTRKRDNFLLADVYNQLGQAYLINGKYQLAIEFCTKSIALANQLPDEDEAFMAYLTLTEVFIEQEKFDLAEKQINIFLKKAKQLNLNKALRKGYGLLATIYYNTNRIRQGLALYEKALKLAYENGDKLGLATAYNNSAIAYFGDNDLTKTKAYFEKALQLRLQLNYPKTICESYYNLVELHLYLNQKKEALFYLNRLIVLAEKHQLTDEQVDAYQKAIMIYEDEAPKALFYAQQLIKAQQKQLKNSFESSSQIETIYQLNKTEEASMLQKIREQMLQSRIQQLEQRQWVIFVAFCALTLASFVIFWRFKKN